MAQKYNLTGNKIGKLLIVPIDKIPKQTHGIY